MKILLTGSTGYIGRRLKVKLLEDSGTDLRLFVRNSSKVREETRGRVEIVEGDTFNMDSLLVATRGIEIAYYLIHSIGSKLGDFEELEKRSAENFLKASIQNGVKRIVYLGGLGKKETASKHLRSRIRTGEILSSRPDRIQTIWFRAGIIIGSGGASFEIIRNLVHKLPIVIVSIGRDTQTQPIAVCDVLRYLVQAKDIIISENIKVDIGSDYMTYFDMLRRTARIIGLKRIYIQLPFNFHRLTLFWVLLLTPVHFKIANALLEGLNSETITLNKNAQKYFPETRPVSFAKAVELAIQEIVNSEVISRWCDSTARENCDIQGTDDVSSAVYVDSKEILIGTLSPASIYQAIQSIGGEEGWFSYNFLWTIRGTFDKLIGGAGINRGRRKQHKLRVGDSLDFWKVTALEPNRRLLLFAQMRLPGRAWLEFLIGKTRLYLRAYFLPRGLRGRIYWYLFWPFHFLIFRDMAKQILRKAGQSQRHIQ